MAISQPGLPHAIVLDAYTGPQGTDYRGTVWGTFIPLSAGMRRVTGATIWCGPTTHTDEITSFTRYQDGSILQAAGAWNVRQSFAVALGKRLNPEDPAPLVRRIWVDGVLSYDNGVGSPVIFENDINRYSPAHTVGVPGEAGPDLPRATNLTWRFYDGNENQMPDPEILAHKGELAPAFRGLMYMVISQLIVGNGSIFKGNTSPVFPVIAVELVDGATVGGATHNFHMLDTAKPTPFNSNVTLVNWETRQLTQVCPRVDTQTSFIQRFDMDSASMLYQFDIADGGDTIGNTDNFATLDPLNDIIYTTRNGKSFISLSPNGTVLDNFPAPFIGGPQGAGGTTPSESNPAVNFPPLVIGSMDYFISGNELKPAIVAQGNGLNSVWVVGKDGTIPALMSFNAYVASLGSDRSVFPFRLYQKGLNAHLSAQDVAFLACSRRFSGSGTTAVEILYCKYSGEGVANIVGRQTLYTGVEPDASVVTAFVDADGQICIQDNPNNGHVVFTRLSVSYLNAPDFSLAPGWRGIFPKVGEPLYYRVEPSGTPELWEMNNLLNSDFSGGTVLEKGATLFRIKDATLSSFGSGLSNQQSTVWDSAASCLYHKGTINGTTELPLQSFNGRNMRYMQVKEGISGEINSLNNVVTYLASAAGFNTGSIQVDSRLSSDQIVGVLIDKPYAISQLFNDIGTVYDFTYFNSGGRLKFERASNSPHVASTTFTFTGIPADGDTATIGSVVYRFKLTPSAPYDVKIEADTNTATPDRIEKTAQNFLAAIAGDISKATGTDGFYIGTAGHPKVKAAFNQESSTVYGFKALDISSTVGGLTSNTIATTDTGGQFQFTALTLQGGEDPPEPVAEITLDKLAFVAENSLTPDDALITTIMPEGVAQYAAKVSYYSLEQTYQYLSQTYTPDNRGGEVANSSNTVEYKLPFVMSTTEAYQRASKTALRNGDNVIMQNFRLPQAWMLLEPTDIISITLAPYSYTVKLDECTFNGDYSTSYSAANYLFRTDIPMNVSDTESSIPQEIATDSQSIPLILDTPLLDPGQFTEEGIINLNVGVRSVRSPFSAAVLGFSHGSDNVTVGSFFQDAKWGLPVSIPTAVKPYYRTVEDYIEVVAKTFTETDTASADDYYDFVAGVNCLALGGPAGWEYVYFRDAVWIGPKTVRFTGLIRAQRGTDAFVGHAPSDVVVLIASNADGFAPTTTTQSISTDNVGETFKYIASSIPTGSKAPVSQDVVIKGYEHYPFSPCQLKMVDGGSNARNLSWERRDRLANGEFVHDDPPMSEAAELYDLEIMNGSTVVRTLTDLTTPSYSYSSANQTADGFSPPLATLKVRVYQKGELGRGFPREDTLNVS